MSTLSQVAENLDQVKRDIADACDQSNRPVDSVELVAVTKYAELPWVEALLELGQTTLGESRPQQLAQRANNLSEDVSWHLIGHLQRNKVDLVLPKTTMIHSVDSWRLLDRIDLMASKLDKRISILLEINVSSEESKDGFAMQDIRSAIDKLPSYQHVDIQGFMAMAPIVSDPEQARGFFSSLRDLRDEISQQIPELQLPQLSMGMSRDFKVAIEEGATLVRVGSRLYDGLEKS
jgi:pyridoxal phosphate enzyme (YggS family)